MKGIRTCTRVIDFYSWEGKTSSSSLEGDDISEPLFCRGIDPRLLQKFCHLSPIIPLAALDGGWLCRQSKENSGVTAAHICPIEASLCQKRCATKPEDVVVLLFRKLINRFISEGSPA